MVNCVLNLFVLIVDGNIIFLWIFNKGFFYKVMYLSKKKDLFNGNLVKIDDISFI